MFFLYVLKIEFQALHLRLHLLLVQEYLQLQNYRHFLSLQLLNLDLKLLADVGLVGFPNAGKSTFLSVVTDAKPKIADYPFTTLNPNLGVVKTENGDSFVIADIPGLIEGASEGVGLGIQFLRHIERTRLILHLIDVSGFQGREPVKDFYDINNELKNYSEKLTKKKQIIVATKLDVAQDRNQILTERTISLLNIFIFLSHRNCL